MSDTKPNGGKAGSDEAPEVDAEIVDDPKPGAATEADSTPKTAEAETDAAPEHDPAARQPDDKSMGTAPGETAAEAAPDEPAPASDRPPRRRLAWTLVVLLLVFIGGAATAPLLYRNLASVGVPLPALAPADTAPSRDLAGLREDLAATQDALNQQREALADLQRALADLRAERDGAEPAPALDTSRFAESDALAALRERVTSLADRIEGMTGQTPNGDRTAALGDRLAALKTRLDSLERTKPGPEALSSLRESVTGRLSTLEEEVAALSNRLGGVESLAKSGTAGPTLAYEVARLQRRMDSGDPFAAEVRALESLLAEDPTRKTRAAEALATLKRLGETGLTPRDTLAERFAALSPTVLRQSAKAEAESGGLWANLQATANALITVRPADPPADAKGLAADLTRIERAARRGEWAGALSLVNGLDAPAREALSAWTAKVRDRLAAERAAERLYRLANPGAADAPQDEG